MRSPVCYGVGMRWGKKENAERNHIEDKIVQKKNGYRMNQVRTKLKETTKSWISIVFVEYLIKLESDMAKKKGKPFWLYTFWQLLDATWYSYIKIHRYP